MRERMFGAAILVATGLAAHAAVGQQPSFVGVDEVRHEPLVQTQPVLGRFVARQGGEVAARTEGPVTEMRVEVGERVVLGDVLAVLDLDRLQLQVDLAKAGEREMSALLQSARAELAKRRQDLERLDGIRESAAFSQARYDNAVQDAVVAESSVAAAAAGLARARASLKIAEDDLASGTVVAPYDGVVTDASVGGRRLCQGRRPVGEPAQRERARGRGRRPLQPDFRLATGHHGDDLARRCVASFGGRAGHRCRRERDDAYASSAFHAHGRGYRSGERGGRIRLGQFAAGHSPQVVSVHKDAILKRQGLSLVYVINAESQAEIRPVELGEAVGPRFEVLNGVGAGEMVVVRGNERLRPGQAVQIGEPPEAGNRGR